MALGILYREAGHHVGPALQGRAHQVQLHGVQQLHQVIMLMVIIFPVQKAHILLQNVVLHVHLVMQVELLPVPPPHHCLRVV